MQSLPEFMKDLVAEKMEEAQLSAYRANGTLGYMDQDANKGTPTQASDVYALGVAMATFVSWIGERRRGRNINPLQARADLGSSNFFDLPKVRSELGDDERGRQMTALLRSMIASEPSKRPVDGKAVLEALERIQTL